MHMDRIHRFRLWLALAVVVVVVAALALWFRGTLSERTAPVERTRSPLSTSEVTLVPRVPVSPGIVAPYPLGNIAMVLLWVALGCVLALAIAFLILRRSH
jgi:integral membrane sensor domain MASE1